MGKALLAARIERVLARRLGRELARRTAADIAAGDDELCRSSVVDAALLIRGALLNARLVAKRKGLPVPSEQDCADALPSVVAQLVRHVDQRHNAAAAAAERAS